AAQVAEVRGVRAVVSKNVNLAACLTEEELAPEQTAPTCPTYMLHSLDYMLQECSAGGGTLQTAPESAIWRLDTDWDGVDEVLLDPQQNLVCYGAPSVFSCGSIGCPYFLYATRGDSWTEIGAINADDAPGLEVMPGEPGKPATLRGGCSGEKPCSELTHYDWQNGAYARSWIDARGSPVDVAPGGLWTVTKNTDVITAPRPGAAVLDEYPAGTAMIVIGNARKGNYRYVSPCTVCRRGFVDASLLAKN
ncbi:MAG TPA: hypothetical protein VLD67_13045, partial [Vicinamibacterales bacterium]|nr:hypothetical protein [Vicinamibacterales bacterium]